MSFPLAAAHFLFVLIARPWAYGALPGALLGSAEDTPIEMRPLQDWQPRRRKTRKTLNVPVCLKPSNGQIGQYPKSYDASLPSIATASFSFSWLRQQSRKDTENRSIAVDSEVER